MLNVCGWHRPGPQEQDTADMTTDTQQPHDSKGEESREKLNKDEGQASGLATDRDERISDSLEQHETPLLQQAAATGATPQP